MLQFLKLKMARRSGPFLSPFNRCQMLRHSIKTVEGRELEKLQGALNHGIDYSRGIFGKLAGGAVGHNGIERKHLVA